jgi:hypothetical protein
LETAVSDNKQPTLEQKIAAALADAGIASADVAGLLSETEDGIIQADQAAATERERAHDPAQSPDPASAYQAMQTAGFVAERLRTLKPRLQQRLCEAEAAEARARWAIEYERVNTMVENAACKFAEYPDLAARLFAIFRDAEAVDQEVAVINSTAPPGEHRRLRQTELVARGLEAFSRNVPAISKTVQLCGWADSERLIWPPPQSSLAVMVAMSMAPPHNPRFTADWGAEVEKDNARRAETEASWAAQEATRQAESKRDYEASLWR